MFSTKDRHLPNTIRVWDTKLNCWRGNTAAAYWSWNLYYILTPKALPSRLQTRQEKPTKASSPTYSKASLVTSQEMDMHKHWSKYCHRIGVDCWCRKQKWNCCGLESVSRTTVLPPAVCSRTECLGVFKDLLLLDWHPAGAAWRQSTND